jgi:hypothetical protein
MFFASQRILGMDPGHRTSAWTQRRDDKPLERRRGGDGFLDLVVREAVGHDSVHDEEEYLLDNQSAGFRHVMSCW